jgi:hypothetical protein
MSAALLADPRAGLCRGVRVSLDDAPAALGGLGNRLQLSSGTQRVCVEHQQGTKYESGIFVPKDDWHAPSVVELALLEGTGACGTTQDIRVFAVPGWLHQFLWDLDLSRLIEDPGFSTTVDDPLFNNFCVEACGALRTLGIPSRRLTVRFQKGGGRSTTYDPQFETFVGLHVDNFERRPIDVRHSSFPRVVVNLGLQPRSFVFINLPLIDLLEPSGIPHGRESYQKYSWAYPLAHRFMAAVPDYPAVRLLLQPGEGYVAPTQNLIHDGYMLGRNGVDVLLSAFANDS